MQTILAPDQAIIGLLIPLILQILKRLQVKGLMWIQQDTPRLAAALSALAAAVTTVGIHVKFDAATHSLLVTGLDPHAIVAGLLGSAAAQFTVQHSFYEGLLRHALPATPKTS
jgi:hypothetical protein